MYTDYLIGGIYHYGKSCLRRFQQLTSVCFVATNGRALRCSLNVQVMLAYEPGTRVLCRTLAFPRKEAND